ncbi:MAG: ATP-dependent Clp protease adaptor ClpS [Cytophagales bacterium]
MHNHKEEEIELLEEVGTDLDRDLIVFNDDFNTFDHVIETLIKICRHSSEQAEQCAWIIHYNGKCSVKKGNEQKLIPMRNAICDRGISAEVV